MAGVYIELDKKRRLSYGLNALVALQDAGVDVEKMNLKDLRTLRAVLWAGLVDDDPSLTQEEVGSLVSDFATLEAIAPKVVEALDASQPDKKPKSKARPRKAQR